MGGGDSKLSKEQYQQVKQLMEKWANNQDQQTNSVLRSQYNRVTDLMNQLTERLSDRLNTSSQDRLERQVSELQKQLETMEKKMNSNEAGSSGNQINNILNDLANTLKPIFDETKGKNADNFPQKSPSMNYSSPMGSQGFGPSTMSQQNNGGPPLGHQGYPDPFIPHPNVSQTPIFHQNYHPRQAPPPYQQLHPPMGTYSGNSYFPTNFRTPHGPMNVPNQHSRNQTMNPTRFPGQLFPNETTNATITPDQFRQSRTANDNIKSEKNSKKFHKTFPSVKNHQENLTKSKIQDGNEGMQKNMDRKMNKITKAFKESRKDISKTSKQTNTIKLEDIERLIAEFKQQNIEDDKEIPPSKSTSNVDIKKVAKKDEKKTFTQKSDQKNDDAEKRNQDHAKRCDKTESGDRREQYKSRGRGKDSHQEWKYKNRQARKKTNPRNINNDGADSDSNESVSSNLSYVSKATTKPADKNKRVFWTTRPNYARDYNFMRVQSRVESVTQGLDLQDCTKTNAEDKTDSVPQNESRSENGSREEKKERKETLLKERKQNADENQPSTSRDSNMKVLNYPSEEKATNEGIDIQKPLERPVLFVGLTDTEEHRTHLPNCLADIYEFEKMYKNFQLISLT